MTTSTSYQTGINNPLTKRQKAVLVKLARKAYEKSGAAGTGMDFQEWRHFMQENAIGKDSLTRATQADFRALRRVFELKSGQPVKAFKTALTEGYENIDQARHRLKKEIEKSRDVWEDPQLWAQGMLKRKRGTEDLNTATAEDLWHIIKTMSSRAAALRKQQ